MSAQHTPGRSCPPKGQKCSACGGSYVCLQWRRNPLVALREKREATHAQMLRADMLGSDALADGNQASERVNKAKAEAAYARGQKWLDRSNTLRDKLIEIDAAIAKATGGAA